MSRRGGDDGDDEEIPGNVILFVPGPRRGKTGRPRKGQKVVHRVIPVVPQSEFNVQELIEQATSPSRKARAAAIMKSRMYTYEEVADFLGYDDARAAASAVAGYVASRDPAANLETLRYSLITALESQVRRSLTFASADYFEDDLGNRFPNDQRLAWHKEARQDLEALARISGAQAAAQVHLVGTDSEEFSELMVALQRSRGLIPEEADVLELEVLTDGDRD